MEKLIRSHVVTLIIILITFPVFAQQVSEFIIPEINWSGWDKYDKNLKEKEAFLSTLSENGQPILAGNLDFFKIVDIDGKNDLDVIKLNNIDSTNLMIYLNNQDNLKLIFSKGVGLIELHRKTPISPVCFKTAKIDNLTGRIEIENYDFSITGGDLNYVVSRHELIEQGTLDVYKNMPPTHFKVKANGTSLVIGPGLDILIRDCSKNESGYAIGSVKTKSGELWWKVYIQEPGYKLQMGWLKRSDVLTDYQ